MAMSVYKIQNLYNMMDLTNINYNVASFVGIVSMKNEVAYSLLIQFTVSRYIV